MTDMQLVLDSETADMMAEALSEAVDMSKECDQHVAIVSVGGVLVPLRSGEDDGVIDGTIIVVEPQKT